MTQVCAVECEEYTQGTLVRKRSCCGAQVACEQHHHRPPRAASHARGSPRLIVQKLLRQAGDVDARVGASAKRAATKRLTHRTPADSADFDSHLVQIARL